MKEGPCYRCLLPQPPAPGLVPSCAEAGVLGAVPGTIGTIQAVEAIKLILGIGEPLVGRLLLFDALDMTFDTILLSKRPDCPVCGTSPTITQLIDYEGFCGVPAYDRPIPEQAAVPNSSVQDIKARLDAGEPLLLLDIREPYELMISQIRGAVNIPLSQLPARENEIPRDHPVVVFCRAGVRSARLIARLQAMGYANLINMKGGINDWSRDIDPSIPRY
jgi:adenylyltransferase/sulfurtransferase